MENNPYQQGSLRLRPRARGAAVWELRYRVPDLSGIRRLKQMIVGTLDQYPNEAAVRAKISGFMLTVNTRWPRCVIPTLGALMDRFIAEEHLLQIKSGRQAPDRQALHYSTASAYLTILNTHIRPRWGNSELTALRPAAVQEWITALPHSPKTKANIKALLHRLFEKAILWEAIELQRNPIELVEVKGVSKRRRIPVVLTPDQFRQILRLLPDPPRTMVLVAQCTGLRVSEVLALQWRDFDFSNATLRITRAVVNGRVSTLKTECSADLLPLQSDLAAVLRQWQAKAPPSGAGWVFPSPVTLQPYFASSIQKRHFRRVGDQLGIHFGWHTFRHTYRSWLDAVGASVGVQQKLMRHAQISTTMNTYGNALMASKRDANNKVVGLALMA